jgi:hypothetical protein
VNKITLEYDKSVDSAKAITAIEKALDITLVAKTSSIDTGEPNIVNGYVNTYQKGGKTIFEVIMYEVDKGDDYVEYVYKGTTYHKGSKIIHKVKEPKTVVKPEIEEKPL